MNPAPAIRLAKTALPAIRPFSTSAAPLAAAATGGSDASGSTSKRATTRRQPLRDWNLTNIQDFQFDDATSLGFLRLEKIRDAQEIVRKVDVDRASLQAQRKPFTPPTGSIRISQTIDLSDKNSLVHRKRVILAAVSRLPLSSPHAIHRFKLLAGPRWTPGRPGQSGGSAEIERDGQEGWVKISEERYPDGLMNRKSAADMLERLTEAANDVNSPIPADTPLDDRHILARERKSRNRIASRLSHKLRAEGGNSRGTIGNVPGFPKEWLQGQ